MTTSEQETQETQPRVTIRDPEIRAMRDMAAAFKRCPPDGRGRVLEWFTRWAETQPVAAPAAEPRHAE